HKTTVAVPQHKPSFTFYKKIVPVNIITGLAGNDLHFPVATFEEVFFHYGPGRFQGGMAGPYPDGFPAVRSQGRAMAEEIVIYPVMVFQVDPVILQSHDKYGALVCFPLKRTVIHPVMLSPELHPLVLQRTIVGVIAGHGTIGYPGIK